MEERYDALTRAIEHGNTEDACICVSLGDSPDSKLLSSEHKISEWKNMTTTDKRPWGKERSMDPHARKLSPTTQITDKIIHESFNGVGVFLLNENIELTH